MSGLRFFVSSISRQMMSDAMADPPGLLIRRTMARTELSARAFRRYSLIVSDPTTSPPGESALRPDAMSPAA